MEEGREEEKVARREGGKGGKGHNSYGGSRNWQATTKEGGREGEGRMGERNKSGGEGASVKGESEVSVCGSCGGVRMTLVKIMALPPSAFFSIAAVPNSGSVGSES